MNQNRLTVTQALLIINIVVFVVGLVVQRCAFLCFQIPAGPNNTSIFEVLGSFSWFQAFDMGQVWRLVTYQFVHANLGHVIFNMWALYFFGSVVERIMGAGRYLAYYLSCGVAGALFYALLASIGIVPGPQFSQDQQMILEYLISGTGFTGVVESWQLMPLVGASASIYGVMVAAAFMYPDVRIRLIFPPVTMQLRTFAWVVIAIAAGVIFFNFNNAGGEAGHLGGIILGSIVMLVWKWRITHR